MIFAPICTAKELTDFSISLGGNIIHDTTYLKNVGAYFNRTIVWKSNVITYLGHAIFTIRTLDAFVLSFLKMHAKYL